MLNSLLNATIRNLRRGGLNFFFKLAGFTLALYCAMIIVVFILFHLSYDQWNEGHANIYRVNSEWIDNDGMTKYAVVPTGVGPGLKDAFAEVITTCRVGFSWSYRIKTDNKSFLVEATQADSTFFGIFSVDFIVGTARSGSNRSIILTESLARQLYGSVDAVGKLIFFSEQKDKLFEVTGVIKDFPVNSHLTIRAILPFNAFHDQTVQTVDPWEINADASTYLYVKMDGRGSIDVFLPKVNRYVQTRLKQQENGKGKAFGVSMQPLTSIHLSSGIDMEFVNKIPIMYVYLFGILAVIVLTIAGINYINLSIVDFQKRLKEISIRKILGASKREIALQVVLETSVFCVMAIVLCVGVLSLYPSVFKIPDENLNFQMLFSVQVLIVVFIIFLALIVSCTAYPIYQLSRNALTENLKQNKAIGATSGFNNSLLLIQYGIALVSVCVTIVVGRQVDFVNSKDPGFDREGIAVLIMPGGLSDQRNQLVKKELSSLDVVESVSCANFVLATGDYYKDWYRVEIAGVMKPLQLRELFFDYDFFSTTGIPLIKGRSFDVSNPADPHNAFIVNETAVKEFGWKDPIGMRISYGVVGDTTAEKWEGTVVGVTKDVYVRSFYEKVEPTVMRLPWSGSPGQCMYVRYKGKTNEAISSIRKKYDAVMPDFPMEYRLLKDVYNAQYGRESRGLVILKMASWIIVLISLIGIFSLSVYMTMKRMKEFGIRKMLGATTEEITFLQVSHFIKIAVLANIVSLPIAYWVLSKWLSGYAYKTEMGIAGYILIAILSIALIVISAGYSAMKAGKMKPLDVIKVQ